MRHTIFGVLLVALVLGGCSGAKSYLPAIDLGLGAVEVSTGPGITSAIEGGSMTKCTGWVAVREAAQNLRDYGQRVQETGEWFPELPAISVQYSSTATEKGCEELMKDGAWRAVIPDTAKPILDGLVLPVVALLTSQSKAWLSEVDMKCRTRVWLVASIKYLGGLIKPLLDELANPDGSFDVAAVPLDFSVCEE